MPSVAVTKDNVIQIVFPAQNMVIADDDGEVDCESNTETYIDSLECAKQPGV